MRFTSFGYGYGWDFWLWWTAWNKRRAGRPLPAETTIRGRALLELDRRDEAIEAGEIWLAAAFGGVGGDA